MKVRTVKSTIPKPPRIKAGDVVSDGYINYLAVYDGMTEKYMFVSLADFRLMSSLRYDSLEDMSRNNTQVKVLDAELVITE